MQSTKIKSSRTDGWLAILFCLFVFAAAAAAAGETHKLKKRGVLYSAEGRPAPPGARLSKKQCLMSIVERKLLARPLDRSICMHLQGFRALRLAVLEPLGGLDVLLGRVDVEGALAALLEVLGRVSAQHLVLFCFVSFVVAVWNKRQQNGCVGVRVGRVSTKVRHLTLSPNLYTRNAKSTNQSTAENKKQDRQSRKRQRREQQRTRRESRAGNLVKKLLYMRDHDNTHLVPVPGDGVLADLVRLGHDLDAAALVVLEDVAVHLAGDAVLVLADLVAAEAHTGALAAHDLVVADGGAAGAGVDAGRVHVQLPRAVVGLDDGVHRALLHVHALVALLWFRFRLQSSNYIRTSLTM